MLQINPPQTSPAPQLQKARDSLPARSVRDALTTMCGWLAYGLNVGSTGQRMVPLYTRQLIVLRCNWRAGSVPNRGPACATERCVLQAAEYQDLKGSPESAFQNVFYQPF